MSAPDPSPYSDHAFLEGASNNSWSNMFHLIPDGSRVLDVGCSTGNFGFALENLKDCSVVGVDLNETDIAQARTRISDARVLDISDEAALGSLGTFDVVVFGDVIEHLVDPRAVLRNVSGILNDRGFVVYSIPNMGHLSVRLDLLDGRFPYTELGLLDRTHLHFYDRAEVYDVFASTGYQITAEAPVVAEYPSRWVADRLDGIGLKAGDTFFAMLKQTDSGVFQYVGTATPRASTKAAPTAPREYVMPNDEIQSFTQSILAENEALRAQLDFIRRHPAVAAFRKLRNIWRRR